MTKHRNTNFQLAIFVSVFVILLTSCEAEPPANIKDPGHLIYLGFGRNREVQCSRCHGAEGTGGMFGPKLRGIVQRKGEAHVRATIQNGIVEEGEEEMPPFAGQLSDNEIEQIIQFLSTWEERGAQ